jgi:hypothetical protein
MKIIGVVRSLGERTYELSYELLNRHLENVYTVSGVTPFNSTVMECVKIGIKTGADYMITCDADVLILPNSVNVMKAYIGKYDNPIITAHTYSKFLKKRQGGIRIWNCSKLNDMLLYITSMKDEIRPEAMIHRKFGGLIIDDVLTIHEFEQYYADIYTRFNFQSVKAKNLEKLINDFNKESDMDFIVAYNGFFDNDKNFNKSFPHLIEKPVLNLKDGIKIYNDILRNLNF